MPTDAGANSILASPLIPLLLIFFIWYVLIIKPQRQKQAEHKKSLEALKKNDDVVTAGGIHGTVVNVKEKTLIVRIDDNVRIEVDKEAISAINRKSE